MSKLSNQLIGIRENKMIKLETLEKIIKEIDYTNIQLEIAWQIELIIKLREKLGIDYQVIPEESLGQKGKCIKKEIDISIKKNNEPLCAIELKMPRNKAYPRRMSEAIKDIVFLEGLLEKHDYKQGFFIFLTDNRGFWEGKERDNIYKYFRNAEKISGKIPLPKFIKDKNKYYNISKSYTIHWQDDLPNIKGNWKYFIIEIKNN